MLSGRFIVSLCFLHRVFAIMNGSSKAMQEVNIKWIAIASEMLAVRKLLKDVNIHDIIDVAWSLCSSVGVPITFEDPIHSQRQAAEVPTGHVQFCESLKEQAIPLILKELDRRFNNQNIEVLAALDALDASKEAYLNHQIMSPLVSRFKDCLTIDIGLLKSECERAAIVVKAGSCMNMNLYSNLEQLVKVSKTLPVDTATIERSFSAMNRVLTWSRNSLDVSMASDFMVLSTNKDILKSLDLDKVLDQWVNQKKRVVPFNLT